MRLLLLLAFAELTDRWSIFLLVFDAMRRFTLLSLASEVGGIMGLLFGVGAVNVLSHSLKAAAYGQRYINRILT